MPAILPCNEVCPNGKTSIVGPYVPNPLITRYQVFELPRDLIVPCPILVGPCNPWWFFRAHGFDIIYDSPEDIPVLSNVERWQFPLIPATLCKVAVRWYEYSESARQNKGPSSWAGAAPEGPQGTFGKFSLNASGLVENRIICDIGNGVNITIPPAGRIEADILVPDLAAFLEDGNILPDIGLPDEATALTRIVPSGFLVDGAVGYPSATFTQSVYVTDEGQPTQTFKMPPLAKRVTAYTADTTQGVAPILQFLFKEAAPLDIPLAAYDVVAMAEILVPENAEGVRVVANGYSGIVTIVFALEF